MMVRTQIILISARIQIASTRRFVIILLCLQTLILNKKNCYCSVQLAPANLSGSICKLPWPIKLRMQWWREAVVFVANFLMFKTYHHDRQWSEVIPSCFYLFLKKWAKSASLPADLHPFTLRVTAITGSNRIGLTGFKLNWAMVPCWSIWKPIFFTVL